MEVTRRAVLVGGISLTTAVGKLAGQQAASEQLHYLTLAEIAARIRKREISPVEIAKAQLARIEARDPALNGYATVMADHALARARIAESEVRAGKYRGPLHGIPIAVKDLYFTKGVPTKGGCKVLADHVPSYDATAVARLEQAGAVLLGKLNTTEGAMIGYNREFKIPRNPWGANRWPGVSSSGPGVATAAGLCFGSLGTDTGGSIRYPSAANGIVGLKPTYGRVSRYGVLALASSLDHVGPMTRSVADAAIILKAIAGYDPNDPTSLFDPVPDYQAEINGGIKGVRVGFDESYCTDGVPAHMADAVRQSVRILEKQGAHVVEARMPKLDEVGSAWTIIAASEAAVAHQATFPSRAGDYGMGFRYFLEQGRAASGFDYAKAHAQRAELVGRIRQAFRDFDVLACPSMASEAFVYDPESAYAGLNQATNSVDGMPAAFRQLSRRFTATFDLSGYPTLSLPCGMSPDGMPLSLQLVGKPLSESLLCRAGQAYERATEWHRRHPPG